MVTSVEGFEGGGFAGVDGGESGEGLMGQGD